MSKEEITTNTNNYSDYLNKLQGVLNADIVYSDDEIVEIHILADTTRSPKQIVRDVQSLFMAQFHKTVDHRIISVAQISSEVKLPREQIPRFVIEGLTIGKRRDHTEIEVALSYDGKACTGKVKALKDTVDVYRGVAQATLCAVATEIDFIQSYSVLDVRFMEIAGDRMAVSCVSLTSNRNITCRFTGNAFSANDDEMAIVRATLHAINRRLGHF